MMDTVIAIVEHGVVTNTIIADLAFAQSLQAMMHWDYVVDITNIVPRPGTGWFYDGVNFTAP